MLISFSVAGLLAMTIARGQSIYSTPYTFVAIAGVADGNVGSNNGTNNGARFNFPEDVAVDSAGNLYVADTFNDTIRKITPVGTNWVVSTIAGMPPPANPGYADGTNLAAQFNAPSAITVDASGNLYVADTGNDTIRKLVLSGTNWVTITIAGTAENPNFTDGTNLAAQFDSPSGVTVDTNGNLYVSDTYNGTIRELTPVGTNWVTITIAGKVENFGSTDATGTNALFNGPSGITVDGAGNLYVADTDNDTIRKLTPTGTNWVVSTIAGMPPPANPGSTDGTNRVALFNGPSDISADGAGNLYVADTSNDTIRKMTPSGTNWVTSTLAGLAGSTGSTNGTGNNALFNFPYGIAADRTGNVYVADTLNSTIRMGSIAAVPKLTVKFAAPNSVVVSWPDLGSPMIQTNGNLATTNWGNYGGTITTTNGTNSITVTPPAGRLFFRLAN
jgi:sugar lactone lactonase YvrE